MNIQERIEQLCKEIDEETKSLASDDTRLLLFGDKDSVFLKAIKRKADLFDIGCDFPDALNPPYNAVVADNENRKARGYSFPAEIDIDHVHTPGMSCVAEAVLNILLSADLVSGSNITIVGRGHAVQGLADELIDHDATVTIAHSKTRNMLLATFGRDVVVYATPQITWERVCEKPSCDTRCLVIDIGNCFDKKARERFRCDYVGNIGRLTVSILLNRAVKNKMFGGV